MADDRYDPTAREIAGALSGLTGIHTKLAEAIGNPDRVWCRQCGASRPVNAARVLRHGWPKCCGSTMTIGQPEPTRG